MAMNPHRRLSPSLPRSNHPRRLSQPIDQRIESDDFVGGRREFRDDRKLVVLNSSFLQPSRIINRILMRNINNALHAIPQNPRTILLNEDFGGVFFVYLAHRLHRPENSAYRLGDRGGVLPFDEVFHVPFAGYGEVLELPAEGEARVAVGGEESLDEAGENSHGGGGVEQSVGGWGREDARLKSEAVRRCVLVFEHVAGSFGLLEALWILGLLFFGVAD